MKKLLVTISLLSATLGTFVVVSHAASLPDPTKPAENEPERKAPPPDGMAGPQRFLLEWQKIFLSLSDDQEHEIMEILATEHEKILPLLKKRGDLHKRLFEAEQAPALDEQNLASLAEEFAKTEAELILSHVKTNRKITALLTPEQREILSKLDRKRRLHHGPPRPERELPPDSEE
ncbi:MAG TPA: Spy/CpxP family protein refolding chaperone [Geobacteraceae bacterium]|nr:Spy/CpxP family protein refolding chaperone [Geobacteraceae bacterium]